MSTTLALYFIVLISGHTRITVEAKPLMTAEQCYAFGEGWRARSVQHSYECHKISVTGGSNDAATGIHKGDKYHEQG